MAAEKTFVFHTNRAHFTSETEAACYRALEIMGGKAETYAKKSCPKDTGRLANSITHQKSTSERLTEYVGTNVEYAPYVELGHHQEVGRYVAAIGARLVNEFVPGKPYIRPSVEDHVSEYKGVLETELGKVK